MSRALRSDRSRTARSLLPRRVTTPGRALAPRGPDPIDTSSMYPYQVTGSRFLRAHARCLLADEMGVGKSVQALRALERSPRAIVVCPMSVCIAWRRQRDLWRPDLSFSMGKLRRPRAGELVVLSGDSLPEVLAGETLRGVTLIVDEIHMFKSDGAQRTERLRMLARRCDRVWGLDGTPMLGVPLDLYGVLESIGLEGIYPSRDAFIAACGGRRVRGRGEEAWEWGDVSPEVRAALQPIMLRRTRREVLPHLPERQYVDVPVPAPDELRTYSDAARARRKLAESRIPAAIEWAQNCASSIPCLVFSAHREPVLAIGELDGAGCFTGTTPLSERARLVDAFQRGDIRILGITIDAGGAGLTLTAAGAVLFVDRDFTPSLNEQAETRPLRPGQKHQSVLIARMMCDHPLDVRREAALVEKARLIAAIVGE